MKNRFLNLADKAAAPSAVILFLTAMGVVRGGIELIWYYKKCNSITILAAYSMVLYMYTLYGSLAYLMLRFAHFFSGDYPSAETKKKFYRISSSLWIIYPLVPIITVLTHDTYSKEIPLFACIPFFLVKNNFLPTGMIAIIPVIVIFYTFLTSEILKLKLLQGFALTVICCSIMYLAFYQFFLRLFVTLRQHENFYIAFAVYHTIMLVFMYRASEDFLSLFNMRQRMFRAFMLLNEIGMVILLIYGISILQK